MTQRNRASGQTRTLRADEWRRAVRDDDVLTPKARLLAFVLSTYMSGDGSRCFPSVRLIKRGMGTTSNATVRNATRELTERGLVRVVQGGGAGNPANTYVPLMPPEGLSPEEAPASPERPQSLSPEEALAPLWGLSEATKGLPETTQGPLVGGTEEVIEGAQEVIKENLGIKGYEGEGSGSKEDDPTDRLIEAVRSRRELTEARAVEVLADGSLVWPDPPLAGEVGLLRDCEALVAAGHATWREDAA
ncbi:MAG TPA: hypothetical protein DCP25_15550 [Chloroflexi bacterium]|jgi:hypothetical protein|nr:hypothetical protein [Chloroflexota bacterium]